MSESDTQDRPDTIAVAPARANRRSGGRERRDPNARPTGPAYIKRVIPTYEVLGEESLLQIEATADRILAEIGLDIRDDDEALALFKKSGAKVDGMRVRFEPGHLQEVLKTAPAQFTQHARNPAHSVPIGGKNIVFSPAYGSPFVMDLDRGRRYGTIEDFQNFIKLAYSSPWLHHSGGTVCEPTDVPVNKRHLDMVYAHMRYSDKAYMGSITSEQRAAKVGIHHEFFIAHGQQPVQKSGRMQDEISTTVDGREHGHHALLHGLSVGQFGSSEGARAAQRQVQATRQLAHHHRAYGRLGRAKGGRARAQRHTG